MRCKNCESLREHNRYLQTLVDKLLMAQGINSVHPSPLSEKITDLIKEETVETFASTQDEYGS
jgi:hypothetical protein